MAISSSEASDGLVAAAHAGNQKSNSRYVRTFAAQGDLVDAPSFQDELYMLSQDDFSNLIASEQSQVGVSENSGGKLFQHPSSERNIEEGDWEAKRQLDLADATLDKVKSAISHNEADLYRSSDFLGPSKIFDPKAPPSFACVVPIEGRNLVFGENFHQQEFGATHKLQGHGFSKGYMTLFTFLPQGDLGTTNNIDLGVDNEANTVCAESVVPEDLYISSFSSLSFARTNTLSTEGFSSNLERPAISYHLQPILNQVFPLGDGADDMEIVGLKVGVGSLNNLVESDVVDDRLMPSVGRGDLSEQRILRLGDSSQASRSISDENSYGKNEPFLKNSFSVSLIGPIKPDTLDMAPLAKLQAGHSDVGEYLQDKLLDPYQNVSRAQESNAVAKSMVTPEIRHSELVRQIAVQVSQHQSGIGNTVELQLTPEELGSVKFRMSLNETGLHIMIHADRSDTQDLMRRHLHLLQEQFSSIGLGDASIFFENSSFSDGQSEESLGGEADGLDSQSTTTQDTHHVISVSRLGVDIRI